MASGVLIDLRTLNVSTVVGVAFSLRTAHYLLISPVLPYSKDCVISRGYEILPYEDVVGRRRGDEVGFPDKGCETLVSSQTHYHNTKNTQYFNDSDKFLSPVPRHAKPGGVLVRHSARNRSTSKPGCFPSRKADGGLGDVVVRSWFLFSQSVPDLHNLSPTRRKHAILKAIEVPAVYWGDKLPSSKVIHHFYGQIVFAKSLSKLEVLVKHGSQRQRNRLVHASAHEVSTVID